LRFRAIAIPTIIVFGLGFASSASGAPQEAPESSEIRSMLREASALIPRIESGQQSSAVANIAGQQVRAGDVEGGVATYQALKSPAARGMSVAVISSAIAAHGNIPLALELVRNSTQPGYRASAYSMIASRLASENSFGDALVVARLIRKEPGQVHFFVDSLMWIYNRQWKAGDQPGAENTLNEALDAVEQERENSSSVEFPIAALYFTIARRLNEAGNRDAAGAMVERIYGIAAAAENPDRKQELVGLLCSAQVMVGQLQAAISSAEELPPGQWHDSAMAAISTEWSKQGDTARALEGVAEINMGSLRNIYYETIAYELAGAGNFAQAFSIIDRVESAGERAAALVELAGQQAEKQDPAAAQTLELAMETAQAAGSDTKPYVFGYIAVTRAELGDVAGAEEMINQMEDPARVWPLWNLTEMLVRAGKKAEAISLAESQSAPHPKAYALLGTATALLDKQHEASRKIADTTK
jgi:hypothetical protein